ncbi:MAG: hypothetical protein E7062_10275 [Spirochaetaceae bacterium]|nr:hypothetical protein [Spirochaetaceae bacterium]
MPWKLIFFIIFLVIATVFIGYNLDNRCNISFVFFQLENIPIFISLAGAFTLGILVVLPFTFGKKTKQKNKDVQSKQKKEIIVKTPIEKNPKQDKNSKIDSTPIEQNKENNYL